LADTSADTSGEMLGEMTGTGAAIAAGTAAAAGMGAAAWSTFSDKQMPPTDAPLDETAGFFGESGEAAGLLPDLAQRDYSEPAPTLDFDPLDWPGPEVNLVPGTDATPGWNLGLDDGVIDPDAGLGTFDNSSYELPEVRYENYISLTPRDAHWAYAHWSVTEDLKAALQQQGGQTLAVRLYDVTGIDLAMTPAHSMQQLDCSEAAQDLHIPIPVSDRDYLVELGYTTSDNRWLLLARSLHIHVAADGAI
jgi:Domain of unknown function (DUF4912)